MDTDKIYCTDALSGLKKLPDKTVDCVITSPPYWGLRDYGVKGQIGLEKDFNQYLERLLNIFDEVYRVLKKEGTVWVNISDTYWGSMQGYGVKHSSSTGFQKAPAEAKYFAASAGKPPQAGKHGYIKSKSMVMIPERFALGMLQRGWILRNVIIWKKPNATPESVKDRFTNDFEYLYFFTKSQKYFFAQQFEKFKSNEYDLERMRQGRRVYDGKYQKSNQDTKNKLKMVAKHQNAFVAGYTQGRNKRTVWEINTRPFKDAHFAVFPEELVNTPILAGCPENGLVVDPFMGSGTTAIAAKKNGRKYIGFDLNPQYVKMALHRINNADIDEQQQVAGLGSLAKQVEKELLKI